MYIYIHIYMYNMYIYTICIYIYIACHFPRIIAHERFNLRKEACTTNSLSLSLALSLSLSYTLPARTQSGWHELYLAALSLSLSPFISLTHNLSAFTRSIRHELRLSARALSLSSLSPPLFLSPSCSHTQHVHGRANMSCVISHSVCRPICVSVSLSQHVRNRADTSCVFRSLSLTHRHTQTLPLCQPTRSDKQCTASFICLSRSLLLSLDLALCPSGIHTQTPSLCEHVRGWAGISCVFFLSLSLSLARSLSLSFSLSYAHPLSPSTCAVGQG